MIKAVLFDLDNTIIDFVRFKKTCIEAAVDAMRAAGLGISKPRARKTFLEIFKEVHVEDRTIFQRFLRRVTGRVDPKMVAIGVVAYRRARAKAYHSYPGIKRVIRQIRKRGIKTGIVTDAPRLKAWIRLVEIGLHDDFDVVVTFDDTGKIKPDPEPFLKALRKLKVKPEDSMFVGDNIERDIVGANRLGMVSVFAKYGEVMFFPRRRTRGDFNKKEARPDFVVKKPKEILSLVKSL